MNFIKKHYLYLIVILSIAAFFRFYKLTTVPSGMINDTAAIAYNAYSIIKTGKDEFGKPFPLIFESFGEGKLPLYVYQALPWVALFGLNVFAANFSSAFFSLLTVFVLYFLALELFAKEKSKHSIALWSTLMLAIMPWHIHFSRGEYGQESLFWIVLGTHLFLVGVRKNQDLLSVLSMLSFMASMLIYHAARVFIPLWVLFLIISMWFKSKNTVKFWQQTIFTGLLIGIPWLLILLSPVGGSRAAGVSVFHPQSGVVIKLAQDIRESKGQPLWFVRLLHNKVESYSRDVAHRYISHFDLSFLFFKGDEIQRYKSPNVGQLNWLLAPFLLIGIYQLIKKKYYILIFWLLIAPLAASITFQTPSTVRAIYMVFPLAVAMAYGIVFIFEITNKHSIFNLFYKIVLLGLIIYGMVYYYDSYFNHLNIREPYDWQDGYQELVEKVSTLQNQYKRVDITDKKGTPYIFFLFFQQYEPVKWQAQSNQARGDLDPYHFMSMKSLDNIRFVSSKCPANDSGELGVLYVCVDEEIPANAKIIDIIRYNDGQPVFVMLELIPKSK